MVEICSKFVKELIKKEHSMQSIQHIVEDSLGSIKEKETIVEENKITKKVNFNPEVQTLKREINNKTKWMMKRAYLAM